jgi:hypothetical protein
MLGAAAAAQEKRCGGGRKKKMSRAEGKQRGWGAENKKKR